MSNSYSVRKLNILYSIVQAMYFAAFSAFCGFQTLFILERGFTGSETGMLASVRCLAGIIAQPILGAWLDRHPQIRLKKVLTVMLLISVALNTLFYATRPSLLLTTLIIFLLGALDLNLYPLIDSLGLQFINAGVSINYAVSRGAGSLAYAVACAVMGVISTALGAQSIILCHTVLLLGAILSINLFPDPPAQTAAERKHTASHSIPEILRRNPAFTLMLPAVFFSVGAVLPVAGFLINVLEPLGGNDTDFGFALFIMGVAELPSAFLYPKLQQRFGSQKVMALAVAGMAVKPLLFLLCPSVSLLLAAQMIQMLGYGIFTPAAVYYANDSVPDSDRVQGQAIMMTASNGLGGMAGHAIAGVALDLGGPNAMLGVFFVMGCLGMCFALLSLRAAKKK